MMTNSKKVFISSSNPSASHARSRGLFFFQEFSDSRTFLLNKKEDCSLRNNLLITALSSVLLTFQLEFKVSLGIVVRDTLDYFLKTLLIIWVLAILYPAAYKLAGNSAEVLMACV